MVSKSLSLIYGMLRLRTCKRVYIHPSSKIKCSSHLNVERNFVVGQDCYIDALSEKGLVCGENVSMGFHTHIELTGTIRFLGKGMIIGNNVGLGSHGHYGSGMGFVEIGDNTIFGNYVSIHPENHNYSDLSKPIREQGVNSKGGVKIGKNCWIGAKVTILDGTKIGDNCIVAAGAVVTGEFPDNTIIGGVPAKIIKVRG
jgi:acetyltransferase-like isoleucine patch superfamily enzyme